MMRENQSDDEDGWPQPPGYVSPWDRHRPPGNTGSPAEHDYPDTVAFDTPPGQQAGYGQGWYGYGGRGGYGNQPGYGQDGGPGWGPPEPPPRRPGWGGRFLVFVGVAALAASIGAGVTVALGHRDAAPAAGISSSDVPAPHDNASGSGASTARLNPAEVRRKVEPGLVDLIATLKYSGETAEGTGMIVSSSGLVLTNNHVIAGATAVHATLVAPGRDNTQSFAARVVGYDVTHDVALLQLQGASGLPTESFGNSSQVKIGTPVLALGNAEGRGGAKPAAGIINGLDRSIQASDEGSNTTENLSHMLQTNARIQQGDSGGALANNAGQVIGMITAANTGPPGRAGTSGGTLGFAIPINSALATARQIASGRASATVSIGLPGFLGVQVAASSSEDPRQQAADQKQAAGGRRDAATGSCQTGNQSAPLARVAPIAAGALIVGVLCDTAASAAGMVPGEVITSVNGQPITTPSSLSTITGKYHPGTVVTVQWVSLDGIQHVTQMQLGPGPAR
jgi:S1-C subfamily serine protease